MMANGLTAWLGGMTGRLRWFDVPLIKLSAAAFMLMVAKLWPPILALDWYWYLVISLAVGVRPAVRAFGR